MYTEFDFDLVKRVQDVNRDWQVIKIISDVLSEVESVKYSGSVLQKNIWKTCDAHE